MAKEARSMTEEIDLKKKNVKDDDDSWKAIAAMARRAAVASEARNAARERTLSSGKVVSKSEQECLDRLECQLTETEFQKALDSNDFDLALDIIEKAAHHKYIRRIPSKREGRKWEYIYNVGSVKHARAPEVGEKVRIAHGDQEGHYEVTHDHGTHVTMTHDESGHTMKMEKEHVHELFRQEHEAAIEEKHKRLKRTREAARVHGSPKQKERAQRLLQEHRERHGIGKEREDKPKPKKEEKKEDGPKFFETPLAGRAHRELDTGPLTSEETREAESWIDKVESHPAFEGAFLRTVAANLRGTLREVKGSKHFRPPPRGPGGVEQKPRPDSVAVRNLTHTLRQEGSLRIEQYEKSKKEAEKYPEEKEAKPADDKERQEAYAQFGGQDRFAEIQLERATKWWNTAKRKAHDADEYADAAKHAREGVDKIRKLADDIDALGDNANDKTVSSIRTLADKMDKEASGYERMASGEKPKIGPDLKESDLTDMKPHTSIFVENKMGKQFKITSGKNSRDWFYVQSVDPKNENWEEGDGSSLPIESALSWVGVGDDEYGKPRVITRGDVKGATTVSDTRIEGDTKKQKPEDKHKAAGEAWAKKVYEDKLKDPSKLPKLGFKDASPEFLAYRNVLSIAQNKLYVGGPSAGRTEKQLKPMSARDRQFWQGVLDAANEMNPEEKEAKPAKDSFKPLNRRESKRLANMAGGSHGFVAQPELEKFQQQGLVEEAPEGGLKLTASGAEHVLSQGVRDVSVGDIANSKHTKALADHIKKVDPKTTRPSARMQSVVEQMTSLGSFSPTTGGRISRDTPPTDEEKKAAIAAGFVNEKPGGVVDLSQNINTRYTTALRYNITKDGRYFPSHPDDVKAQETARVAAEKVQSDIKAKRASDKAKREAHEERPGATAVKLVGMAIEHQDIKAAKKGVDALKELAQQPGMKTKAVAELRSLVKDARTIAKRRQGKKYSRTELETARSIRDYIDNARADITASKGSYRGNARTEAGGLISGAAATQLTDAGYTFVWRSDVKDLRDVDMDYGGGIITGGAKDMLREKGILLLKPKEKRATAAGKIAGAIKERSVQKKEAEASGKALVERHKNDPEKVVIATSTGPRAEDAHYTKGNYSVHKARGDSLGGVVDESHAVTHRPSGMRINTLRSADHAKQLVDHMHENAPDALANLGHGVTPGEEHAEGKQKMLDAFRSFGKASVKPVKPKKTSDRMARNLTKMSRGYSTFFTDLTGGADAMYDLKHHGLVQEGKLDGSYVLTDKGKKAAKEGKFEPVPYTKKSLEQAALSRLGDRLMKADNSVDIDTDAGFSGVAEYGGQVSMRVHHNEKCNGCNHYDHNQSACEIGLVPKVCGDGSHPEVGYNPAHPNRIAAKNWTMRHRGAVVPPVVSGEHGSDAGIYPYRVEVLGDSALALSERMTLVKSATKQLAEKGEVELQALRDITGVEIHGPLQCDINKGALNLNEFADAMGTTADVVRSIARRLGSRHDFAEFIKSKLPDIRMAHGLDEDAVGELYEAAQRTIKSLSPTQWELWKGVSFENSVDDESLATAIAERGLLDPNALHGNGIITPAEPQSALPPPEPVQNPEQQPVAPTWVGGNLHLAKDL